MKLNCSLHLFILVLLVSQCSIFPSVLKEKREHNQDSFLQIQETDDYDDDDADEAQPEVQKLLNKRENNLQKYKQKKKNSRSKDTISNSSKLVFTELKSKIKGKSGKKEKKKKIKEIDQLKTLKRKRQPSDRIRMKLFRIGTMNEMQKTQQWRQSRSEIMRGKFSKVVAAQGNKNADEFVSFLGFMRDSSFRGNQNVYDQSIDRFFK